MKKKVCIICRKSKLETDFNIEHIIPESIGNKHLTIDTVCEECNSKLGNKVDYEITNNMISQLDRFINKSKGKSRKIPNPFREGRTLDGRIVYCDDNLKPSLVPKVDFDTETGKYNVSASSLDEAIKIINKKLKRSGKSLLTNEQIKDLQKEVEVKREQPTVQISGKVDFYNIYLGFIKIAYEFMYYLVGQEYLKDEKGIKLSNILKDYIYYGIEADCDGIIGGLPHKEHENIVSKIKVLGKQLFGNENIHYMQLVEMEDSTIINIILYSSFNYSVIVSKNSYNLLNSVYMINPINGENTSY